MPMCVGVRRCAWCVYVCVCVRAFARMCVCVCMSHNASNAMTRIQTIFCSSVRELDTAFSPLAMHFEC